MICVTIFMAEDSKIVNSKTLTLMQITNKVHVKMSKSKLP